MLTIFRTCAAVGAILSAAPLSAQDPAGRFVRGFVSNAEDVAPIMGATLVPLDGAQFSPITVAAGRFRVWLPSTTVRLVAAHVGFVPDTVVVGPQDSVVQIVLQPAPLQLLPIVVASERAYSAAATRSVREVDVHLRPRQSSQELLQLAPGLVIAQHAGGGKAEQIFLRGFDADHGTDVAINVDGLPVNMVSHAHGQGYADLHFLMPELVERIEVRKGPYDVRDGDFATAGAVLFHTFDRIARPSAELRFGSFGTMHGIAIQPINTANGESGGYVAGGVLQSDGPFDASQNHRRLNMLAKWSAPAGRNHSWFSQVSAFSADWDASGQIPDRAVSEGRIDRFGAIDPTEGGRTSRYDVTAGVRSMPGSTSTWEAQAFLTRYDFRLFSNFTFFLNDTIVGDGIEQQEARWLTGFRASYDRVNRVFGNPGTLKLGASGRGDHVDLGLYHQVDRERLGDRVDARVVQSSAGAWIAQDVQLLPRLRASLGMRGDIFRFDVHDRLVGSDPELPHASGTEWRGMVNPRMNVALDAGRGTALYLSGGGGFHSNDARDVILAGPDDTVLPRAWGVEVGARKTAPAGTLAVGAWGLDLDSELVYVGDEGTTEPSGRTRRIGLDVEGRLRIVSWLWADGDLNLSRGRARDEPAGANRIPLAPEVTATGGLVARDIGSVEGGIRFRHIGSRPADETNTVRALGYTVWELFGSRQVGALEVSLTVDNLFDATWNEAQFATTSRLRHEPEAVTELHFTPGAPRGIHFGLRYIFK